MEKKIVDAEKAELKVEYCIPDWLRDQQIQMSCSKIKNRIQPIYELNKEPIALVCFGPSLNQTWQEVKKFKYVMSCSGSHKFLRERGITPTYHIELDPRAHKIQLIGNDISPDTEFLIASCCHPLLFEHLEKHNAKITLWHTYSGENKEKLPLVYPRGDWVLTGGANVGLRAMVMCRFLGFNNLSIFGMDGSFSADSKLKHAAFHPNICKNHILAEYEGKQYATTTAFLECLPGYSLIETEDGLKKLSWIVKNKYTGKVLSFDGSNFVFNKVIGHSCLSNKKSKKQWIGLSTSVRTSKHRLVCTEDHNCAIIEDILRPTDSIKYVQAKNTLNKFLVRLPISNTHMNENSLYNLDQISVLIGTLIGDGYIDKFNQFKVSHCEKQKEYIELKQNILKGRLTDKYNCGFSGKSHMYHLNCPVNGQIVELRKIVYPNGKKTIKNILKYVNEISLAFWYMDDGYIDIKHGKNNKKTYYAFLCTDSFDYEEHLLICKFFKDKWNINAKIAKITNRGKKYYRIRFNRLEALKLFSLISKYIPEAMQYKLPEIFRSQFICTLNTVNLPYAGRKVIALQPKKGNIGYYSSNLYDIEVENAHNFIANKTLVHNCGRMVFHELEQLPDVSVTFYGEGLVQAMAKDKVLNRKKKVGIAFHTNDVISELYRQQNAELHQKNPEYGTTAILRHAEQVKAIYSAIEGRSLLDYGCLSSKTKIQTEDGIKTIKWIVDHKYNGKVLSLANNNYFKWNRVVKWWKRPNISKKKWVKILVPKGKSRLICTEDHPCASIENILKPVIKYIPAKKLKGKFSVRCVNNNYSSFILENPLYNEEQISVLVGIGMGDGYFDRFGRMYNSHGLKQKEYVYFKKDLLGGKIIRVPPSATGKSKKDGYFFHCSTNAQTKELRKLFYPDNKKIPGNVLPYFNEISLAFWYMDDGRLKIRNKVPYVEIHTEGFKYSDQLILKEFLKNKWNLNVSIYKKDNYYYLHFNKRSSEVFFKLVASFVHPSMNYKLPSAFCKTSKHKFNNIPLAYSAIYVREVLQRKIQSGLLYDIEVENDHNFIANKTLVHNCGKGMLGKQLDFPIWEYDPAIPGKDQPPRPADFVVCIDVLEHVEPEYLDRVIEDIYRCTKKIAFFAIGTKLSTKNYPNGKNTHLTIKTPEEWVSILKRYFIFHDNGMFATPNANEISFVAAPIPNAKVEKDTGIILEDKDCLCVVR